MFINAKKTFLAMSSLLLISLTAGWSLPTGCLSAVMPSALGDDATLDKIKLPDGFSISVYAKVPNARSLALGDQGTVFVGNRSGDKVYAVVDEDDDRKADKVYTLASGLDMPNGVAFFKGALYVAENSRIIRFDDIENKLADPGKPVTVYEKFPDDRHHGWKFIAFGPDGLLYVPVGAPCNNCLSDDPIYASITRIKPDGGGFEIHARGIRNTVGFDWNPKDGSLWFTDNGRDWLGDDRPPDELNQASRPGLHFGYPFCHGDDIADPEFGGRRQCGEFVKPKLELGPHVAALGMRFYTGKMFPPEYRGNIFIAEHGSWNRSSPTGYRVTRVVMEEDRAVSSDVFAEGWLVRGVSWGRPVDVLVMPDGSLLVSDDKGGRIYRIAYEEK